jgi:nickel transport protein
LGSLFTALELGLQPLLHSGVGKGSLYFPFPLKIAIPAVMIPHLTAVGLLEVTVTVLVLLLIFKTQPAMSGWAKTVSSICVVIFLILLPSFLLAHDFWIEKKGSEFMIVYGHGAQRLEFDSSKVKTIKAFDVQGKEIGVDKEKRGTGILLKAEGPPSLFFVEIDDGYWSKTIYGWKNLPKRKASRVVESIRSYYSKALLSWGEAAQKPVADAKLDIIPLENPLELKDGATLPVRILYQGKPISGLEIEAGDHHKIAATDKEGIARVKLSKGHQVLSVNHKEPVKNDPDADSLSITSTLTFEVTK